MNLVVLGGFPYPDGNAPTQLAQAMVSRFLAHGHAVRVLSLGGRRLPAHAAAGNRGGADWMVCGLGGKKGGAALGWPAYWRESLRFLRGGLDPKQDSAVICIGPPSLENLHLTAAARRRGATVIHWLFEDWDAYDLSNVEKACSPRRIRIYRFFFRRLRRFTDGVAVLSSRLESKFEEAGFPLQFIPISSGRLDRLPAPAGEIQRGLVFYSGTYGAKDGVEVLIEGFLKFHKDYPSARLALGGWGPDADRLKVRYAAQPAIEFLGRLDDAAYDRQLRTADILCMTRVNTPFANAGFPFKLGDYLAAGRPVIASRVSDVERYLEHEKSAMLVDAGDADQIGEALRRLLGRPDWADALGRAGREACEVHFDPEANSRALEEFIQRVRTDKAGRSRSATS